ncbi:MAG: hypothetical protein WBM34_17850 [Woeseiaceae bacterium]
MVILDKNARGLRGADTLTRLSRLRLFSLVLLLCAAFSAQAQGCSGYINGALDSFAGDVAPSQLQIDRHCTVRDCPASSPSGTNFSFFTQPGQTNKSWLTVFNKLVRTGNLWTLENFPIVPASEQFIIEITVVLEDAPTNTPNTQFVNSIKWDFGMYEIATS